MPLDTLKKVIETISDGGGDYIQLHLSDHERYAVYSEILGLTSDERNNGNYYTKEEVKELVEYASDLNVAIYPDLDIPYHSTYWLNRVKEVHGQKIYEKVVSNFDSSLVDYFDNDFAVSFIDNIIKELSVMFDQGKKVEQAFSIGADEVPGTNTFQAEFIGFVNKVASTVRNEGYIPRVWNDSFKADNLSELHPSIEVVYWTQGYETAQTFVNNEITIHNSNFYSLVFSPDSTKKTKASIQEQAKYVRNTHASNFFNEKDSKFKLTTTGEYLGGTAYTIWNEGSLDLNEEEWLFQVIPLIKNYLLLR